MTDFLDDTATLSTREHVFPNAHWGLFLFRLRSFPLTVTVHDKDRLGPCRDPHATLSPHKVHESSGWGIESPALFYPSGFALLPAQEDGGRRAIGLVNGPPEALRERLPLTFYLCAGRGYRASL